MTLATKKPKDPGLDALRQLFGSGGGSGSGDGRVYMGTISGLKGKDTSSLSESAQAHLSNRRVARWTSKDEALGDFFHWSNKKTNDFIAQATVGGLLKRGDGAMEAAKLWSSLVDLASLYGKAGKRVSPFDLMRQYVRQAGHGVWVRQGDFEINSMTGEKRYVGPRFKTTTDTRVDLTDPDTAKAMATKIFQDMMGRDPHPGELGAFAKAINRAERANPTVTTQTTEFDTTTGEPIATTEQSRGGFTDAGRELIGENQIKKKKEYGAFQAATTYQNALENAVFGAPDLGGE